MKLNNASIKILFLILVLMTLGRINQSYAEDNNTISSMKVLWQEEITADANMDCSLGQVAFDRTNEKILITGTSFPQKAHFSEGKLWLMNVDSNSGNLDKISFLKDFNESEAVPAKLAMSLISSLAVSENNNVTLTGKLGNFGSPAIMKVNKEKSGSKVIGLTIKNNDANKNIEGFSQIHGGLNLLGDNTLLIGGGRKGGLIAKVNSEGVQLWKKNYKIGQREVDLFTDVLSVTGEEGFAIVGCSTNVKDKFPDVIGDDFIVKCNAQGDVIAKDIFTGNPGEQPQICQVSSGNFIVVYGKGVLFKQSDINIRAYSPDLRLLWEKSIIKSKKNKPSSFQIATTQNNRFVVAANVDFGDLRVCEYDKEGNQIASFSMDRAIKQIAIGLACSNKYAFVVFQARPKIEQGDGVGKIKIIALELK